MKNTMLRTRLVRVQVLALLTCCLSGPVLCQQANPSARSSQSIAEMKSEVMLDALVEALLDQGTDQAALENAISRSPALHIEQAASRELLAKSARERFAALVQAGIGDVYEKVNRDQDHELVSRDWLLRRVENIRPGKLAEAESLAMNRFDDSYTKARAATVQKQLIEVSPVMQGLSLDVALIERASGGSDVRADALALVKARLKTAGWLGRLFDENQTVLTNNVEDLIRRGVQELEAQKRVLATADVKGASTPRIAANLKAALQNYVKSAHGTYDVFPSVVASIAPRASAVMKARFQAVIQPEKVASLYEDETLRKAIVADPTAHRVRTESLGLLYKTLLPTIQMDLITAHFTEQQESLEGHLPEFKQLLEQEPYRSQLDFSFRQSLERRTPSVRIAVGAEQIRKAFGDLGTRPLGEDAIDWYKTTGSQASLADLVEKLGFSPAEVSLLIEEAANQLSLQIQRIFTEGRDALDAQFALAESQRPMIDQWHRSGKDRDEAFAAARSGVSVLWRKRQSKFADLFQHTEKRVAEIVELVYSVPAQVELRPLTAENAQLPPHPLDIPPAGKRDLLLSARKDNKTEKEAGPDAPGDKDTAEPQVSAPLPQVPRSLAEEMDILKSKVLAAQNDPNFDQIKQHIKAIWDLLHPSNPEALPRSSDTGIATAAVDPETRSGISTPPRGDLIGSLNDIASLTSGRPEVPRPWGGTDNGGNPAGGRGGSGAAGTGAGPGGVNGAGNGGNSTVERGGSGAAGTGAGPGGGNGTGNGGNPTGERGGSGAAGTGAGSGRGDGTGNGGNPAGERGGGSGAAGTGVGLGGGNGTGYGGNPAGGKGGSGAAGAGAGPGSGNGAGNHGNPTGERGGSGAVGTGAGQGGGIGAGNGGNPAGGRGGSGAAGTGGGPGGGNRTGSGGNPSGGKGGSGAAGTSSGPGGGNGTGNGGNPAGRRGGSGAAGAGPSVGSFGIAGTEATLKGAPGSYDISNLPASPGGQCTQSLYDLQNQVNRLLLELEGLRKKM